jgi:hypothetical protein
MSNVFNTARLIARMTMVELENDLTVGKLVYRDYTREFGPGKSGSTVDIRRPVQFQAVEGPSVSFQDITDGNETLTINRNVTVPFQMSVNDMSLNVEQLAERIVRPAARVIANEVERSILAEYWRVPHWVGTPGNLLRVRGDVGRAVARLTENGVPESEPVALVGSVADIENVSNDISRLPDTSAANQSLRDRLRGKLAGADTYSSNLLTRHTRGAWSTGGTIEVDGANQNVTYNAVRNTYTQTLNIKGASTTVTNWARRGDVFEIENVFAVNPVTKQPYAHRRQFTVMADANSDGGGLVALTISPPLISSGPYQTVSVTPADSADVFVIGAATGPYTQNLAFHKNAFALAMIPMERPVTAPFSASESYKGYSITLAGNYDVDNNVSKFRMDVLFGVKCINPELAIRVSGTAS